MVSSRRRRRAFESLTAGLAALALAGCGEESPGTQGFPAEGAAAAASAGGTLQLKGIGRFDSPLFVASPPGDARRLFVVEQGGKVKIVRGGRTLATPFLDVSRQVTSGGEQGLLSIAFAPDYATSGRFYVYFTDKEQQQRVVEYRRTSADRADPRSARLVLRMADPEANHNGGAMVFGPDRLLYIATGDGGGGNDPHGERGNAQDLGSPLGKLLRIDPRASAGRPYTVPAENPFVGRAGARGEVYSYGLRNPWRFTFDRSTGDLIIGDVGQNAVEEVDFLRKGKGRGANFGWRPLEGRRVNVPEETAPGAVPPVIEKSHDDGWCSVTGGYVVRDPDLPSLRGQYLYGDFCQGRIRAAKLGTGGAANDRQLPLRKVDALASFGEDARGRIFVVSLAGAVYRLTAG